MKKQLGIIFCLIAIIACATFIGSGAAEIKADKTAARAQTLDHRENPQQTRFTFDRGGQASATPTWRL